MQEIRKSKKNVPNRSNKTFVDGYPCPHLNIIEE